jgi:multiple sugar transport system ATP-binding protein
VAGLSLRGVSKAFGDTEVLRAIDLDVQDREFVVFVGPSGCGKSTLLRLIAGLEDTSDGDIMIGEREVTLTDPAERGVAMVFQSYALYPHMNVFDNMAFGLKMGRQDKQAIRQAVERAAEILQIGDLLDKKPRHLSGGQRQRVAIGRAIVRNPGVFLFDEPLSNLDAALRVQMRVELARLHSELQATMVYVTHDQVEAMTLADRIVVLNQGRIEQVGTPLELYRAPVNRFVAGFIGSPKMNFLDATVRAVRADGVTIETAGGQAVTVPAAGGGVNAGQTVTLGVRPEHLQAGPDAHNAADGTVVVAEHMGSETYVYTRLDSGDSVMVRRDGETPVAKGDRVRIGFSPAYCHVFDAHGRALKRLEEMPIEAADAEAGAGA